MNFLQLHSVCSTKWKKLPLETTCNGARRHRRSLPSGWQKCLGANLQMDDAASEAAAKNTARETHPPPSSWGQIVNNRGLYYHLLYDKLLRCTRSNKNALKKTLRTQLPEMHFSSRPRLRPGTRPATVNRAPDPILKTMPSKLSFVTAVRLDIAEGQNLQY